MNAIAIPNICHVFFVWLNTFTEEPITHHNDNHLIGKRQE